MMEGCKKSFHRCYYLVFSYVFKDDVRTLVGTHQLELDVLQMQTINMTGEETVCRCGTCPSWFGIVRALLAIGRRYLLATTTILYTDIAQ